MSEKLADDEVSTEAKKAAVARLKERMEEARKRLEGNPVRVKSIRRRLLAAGDIKPDTERKPKKEPREPRRFVPNGIPTIDDYERGAEGLTRFAEEKPSDED